MGIVTGKIAFYCEALSVTRQGFYKHLKNMNKPYKYELLSAKIKEIIVEDEYNDTYGYVRIHQALELKKEQSNEDFPDIPSERTVYRVMQHEGLIHKQKRKPNGITKADKEARKSDNLLKEEKNKKQLEITENGGEETKISDFEAHKPCSICVTDITEIPCNDGKLYLSAIEDCFDNAVLGLSMDNNMEAHLCKRTLEEAVLRYPELIINKAIIHSDRGSQYTSELYRTSIEKYKLRQSMNSAAGRCHDNAKCESLWARFKEELLYGRYDTKKMKMKEVKTLIWRYFMSYWNNRRICSANDGLPPMEKRRRYFVNLNAKTAA